jgi:hypothetical protein
MNTLRRGSGFALALLVMSLHQRLRPNRSESPQRQLHH